MAGSYWFTFSWLSFRAVYSLKTHYRAVNYAQGVLRLVSFGATPAIVDGNIIESIRSRIEDGFVNLQSSSNAGQRVRILEGPFQGLEVVFYKGLSDY